MFSKNGPDAVPTQHKHSSGKRKAHKLKKILGPPTGRVSLGHPAGQTGVYWPVSEGFPVVCYGKADIFAGTPAGCPRDTRPSRGFSEVLYDFFLCVFSASEFWALCRIRHFQAESGLFMQTIEGFQGVPGQIGHFQWHIDTECPKNIYNVQMDAAVLGDRLLEGTHKPPPWPRQPLFAVPALRELEMLAGLAFCEMLSQYPRSAFQGLCGGHQRGSAAVCDPNPPRPFARYREYRLEIIFAGAVS